MNPAYFSQGCPSLQVPYFPLFGTVHGNLPLGFDRAPYLATVPNYLSLTAPASPASVPTHSLQCGFWVYLPLSHHHLHPGPDMLLECQVLSGPMLTVGSGSSVVGPADEEKL